MILVFKEKSIREEFERNLKGACIYHKNESEVFGENVSSEDYVNRSLYGASIPFYKEIYRKRVAQKAMGYDYVILDCDPHIPDEVNKCPVIYITDRTEGNDEEFGQLPVKYAGSVEETIAAAQDKIHYWLEKYGEGRSEKEFYKDFLDAAIARVPRKLRIVAIRGLHDEYAAGVALDFDDENIGEIEELISKVSEFNLAPFVDSDTDNDDIFKLEDFYFSILWGESSEDFLKICQSLGERNDRHREDGCKLRGVIKDNKDSWIKEIYNTIYLDHIKAGNEYEKVRSGYIQIFYRSAYKELKLEELGIEVGIDDVVFLDKALEYFRERLSESLGDDFELRLSFYGERL